jgi:hypothetical protein
MRSLGHAGCVTARGWDAIHHPGSAEPLLKLFSIANVGRAATGLKSLNAVNEDGFVINSLKELSDMIEVKAALQNLCMAAQLAAPWNFSYLVIDSFLKSTTNMEAELASYKKAPIVAAFIDHVLQVNATNWVWESWWCARKGAWKAETMAAAASTTSGSTNAQASNSGGQGDTARKNNKRRRGRRGGGGGGQGGQNNGGGDGSFGGQQQNGGGPPFGFFGGPQRQPGPNAPNLCRRYNEGTCNNHHSACSFLCKFNPVKLYHLCNFMKRDNNEQKLYMERHSRVEFHK